MTWVWVWMGRAGRDWQRHTGPGRVQLLHMGLGPRGVGSAWAAALSEKMSRLLRSSDSIYMKLAGEDAVWRPTAPIRFYALGRARKTRRRCWV
ncbi:hypothetical protein TB1_008408 [Malus domestica]